MCQLAMATHCAEKVQALPKVRVPMANEVLNYTTHDDKGRKMVNLLISLPRPDTLVGDISLTHSC